MSIATLKQKTKNKYNLTHNKNDTFSLNGIKRNSKPINSNYKFSVIKTNYKGTLPVGSGSCCGNYYNKTLCYNGITSHNLNTANAINESAINTHGYIRKITRSYKWVQDFNALNKTQSFYIKNKKNNSICNNYTNPVDTTSCPNYYKNTNNKVISESEYIDTKLLTNNCLPTTSDKQHFPFSSSSSSCNKDYLTPQQAINDNLLPITYIG